MKHRKKKKGASLIIVLMVLAVAMIFSSVTLTTISKTTKANAQEKKSEDVLFSAESGLEYGIAWFNKNKSGLGTYFNGKPTNSLGQKYNVIYSDNINSLRVEVRVVEVISNKKYIIESIAGNKKVSVYMENQGSSTITINTAVYGKNNITLEGGYVLGNIETSSFSNGSITASNDATITGTVIIPPNGNFNIFNWTMDWKQKPNVVRKDSEINYLPLVLPTFPDKSTLNQKANVSLAGGETNPYFSISGNSYYDRITIDKNRTLQINTNGGDTIIRIANLEMIQGKIVINGTGKVYLYVDNCIRVKGYVNVAGNKNNLAIYCNNSNTLSFDNETIINGSIYLSNASLVLANSGSVTGDIVTSGTSIQLSGASNNLQVIYAPNASISLVGGASIKGAVIGKSIYLTGGAKIEFTNQSIDFHPPTSVEGSSNYKKGNPNYENN
ncbi:DUF7305 domain-containing protein [Clostridium sp. UBA1652]|uniref:DUF7305 domain-containing protein n=1 Tax=Clostridium sp. UBA1652 TaxID=1946348 RepID=UPI00258095F1|nr:hypothetical protein [Clostridium sp. UBA1652]